MLDAVVITYYGYLSRCSTEDLESTPSFPIHNLADAEAEVRDITRPDMTHVKAICGQFFHDRPLWYKYLDSRNVYVMAFSCWFTACSPGLQCRLKQSGFAIDLNKG